MKAGIKTGWLAPKLPGVRPHPEPATYSLFSYEDLPTLPSEALDPQFAWLQNTPVREGSIADSGYADGTKPDIAKLPQILPADAAPSASFLKFMASVELHRRLVSVTDCYLDVADRVIRTTGSHTGYLVHFLSDSQWCAHWYLHVTETAQHILVSPNAYGFDLPDDDESETSWQKSEIDLEQEEIYLCAQCFPEFIYRFWIENELWHALVRRRDVLTSTQEGYIAHYRRILRTLSQQET